MADDHVTSKAQKNNEASVDTFTRNQGQDDGARASPLPSLPAHTTGLGSCGTSSYEDFSQMLPQDLPSSPKPKRGSGRKRPTFPTLLHDLLRDCYYEEEFKDVVFWHPHGRSFIVMNPLVFKTRIMPRYFRLSQYPSFIRQLNFYGFKRLENEPDKAGYYHPKFLREKRFLAKTIKRPSTKSKAEEQSISDDNDDEDNLAEPNLHAYSFLPQVGEGEDSNGDALDSRLYDMLVPLSSGSSQSTSNGEGKHKGGAKTKANPVRKKRKVNDTDAVEMPPATFALPVVENDMPDTQCARSEGPTRRSHGPKDMLQQIHKAHVATEGTEPKAARDSSGEVPVGASAQFHGVRHASTGAETSATVSQPQQQGIPAHLSQQVAQLVNGEPLQRPVLQLNLVVDSNQAGLMIPVSAMNQQGQGQPLVVGLPTNQVLFQGTPQTPQDELQQQVAHLQSQSNNQIAPPQPQVTNQNSNSMSGFHYQQQQQHGLHGYSNASFTQTAGHQCENTNEATTAQAVSFPQIASLLQQLQPLQPPTQQHLAFSQSTANAAPVSDQSSHTIAPQVTPLLQDLIQQLMASNVRNEPGNSTQVTNEAAPVGTQSANQSILFHAVQQLVQQLMSQGQNEGQLVNNTQFSNQVPPSQPHQTNNLIGSEALVQNLLHQQLPQATVLIGNPDSNDVNHMQQASNQVQPSNTNSQMSLQQQLVLNQGGNSIFNTSNPINTSHQGQPATADMTNQTIVQAAFQLTNQQQQQQLAPLPPSQSGRSTTLIAENPQHSTHHIADQIQNFQALLLQHHVVSPNPSNQTQLF